VQEHPLVSEGLDLIEKGFKKIREASQDHDEYCGT
jgi:hypothetical protein